MSQFPTTESVTSYRKPSVSVSEHEREREHALSCSEVNEQGGDSHVSRKYIKSKPNFSWPAIHTDSTDITASALRIFPPCFRG